MNADYVSQQVEAIESTGTTGGDGTGSDIVDVDSVCVSLQVLY
jgi:hypothetical protein